VIFQVFSSPQLIRSTRAGGRSFRFVNRWTSRLSLRGCSRRCQAPNGSRVCLHYLDAFRILLLSVSSILNLSLLLVYGALRPAIATDGLVSFLHRSSLSQRSTSQSKMRYQDWDVLLFPEGSKVPIQEFKTQCHVTRDLGETLQPLSFPTNRVFQNLHSSIAKPLLAFHLRAMVPRSHTYRFSLPSFQACSKMHPSDSPFITGRSQDLHD
jgi:hypothetical protein